MYGQMPARRHHLNAGLLVGFVVLLVALIPSAMVLPAFGEFGHPATLLCLLLMGIWLLTRLHHRMIAVGAQPMRWLAWLCLAAACASYAAGLWRGLTPAQDDMAIRALLGGLGFFGVILATSEGLRSKERLDGLICLTLIGAAVIAVLGMVWAAINIDITAYLDIPGLVRRGDAAGPRITPELGAVLVLLLPFAIHMGRFARTRPERGWMGLIGVLMVLALATAPSRTALLALAVLLVVLIPAWTWRTRFNLLTPSLLVVAAMLYLMPDLPRSIAKMFTEPGNDVVAAARGRWAAIPEQAWPGGHWLVGVIALAALHLGAFVLAALAFRRSVMLADRHLCACLMATQLMGIALGFTFAPFELGTYPIFMAIATGACAAMWRLSVPRRRRVVSQA
ncbi:hypothetical protein Rhe02_82180 [Rhizocola hellebori]|uniref:O-antigen ligase domain-containing protein n=1 Tax=Rhizocola hellebori TaxID=1392758 RepID=A0A8J3VLK6_9ACTN|nr:hypothetical protein [Rhizocola hellebori]GIH10151.1 hypothetical protein Rhe02_82180 [Rhizocola hellebori]